MFNFFLDGEENMLKKAALLTISCILPLSVAQAQSSADFYQDLLISDEVKANEAKQKEQQKLQKQMQDVQDSARSLLTTKTKNLKIDVPQIERRNDTEPSDKEVAMEAQNLDSAPFGLLWKASEATIKNMGIILTPAEQEDYVNSFDVSQLPVETKGFRRIQITFGEEDELWRIIAYGDFLEDTPEASKGLRQYEMYARLLNQKYGNQKDFYTPAMKTVEKEVMINGRKTMQTEQIPEKIGNPNFLSQLQEGTATLYSTFEGKGIGAALALNVDGDGKSYIVIDYKNLNILKERENETLNIL